MKQNQIYLSPGQILKGQYNRYRIVKTLGQGSFGITYLADVILEGGLGTMLTNYQVAIKEFFMKEVNTRMDNNVMTGTDADIFCGYKKYFKQEAVRLSNMKHPGIVNVLDVFETNNTCYYVMAYHSSGTIHDYIRKNGSFDPATTIQIIRKVAEAVGYMHNRHMLHLDIKPSNIMLDEHLNPILIDFGLSKQYDEDGNPENSSLIRGCTPPYSPLEQMNYASGNEFAPTLDIYALGVTLLHMLSGCKPPEASVILNDDDALTNFFGNKHVYGTVCDFIVHAIQPKKTQRIQTIQAFMEELSHITCEKDRSESKDEIDDDNEDTLKPDYIPSSSKETKKVTDSPEKNKPKRETCLGYEEPDEWTEENHAHEPSSPIQPCLENNSIFSVWRTYPLTTIFMVAVSVLTAIFILILAIDAFQANYKDFHVPILIILYLASILYFNHKLLRMKKSGFWEIMLASVLFTIAGSYYANITLGIFIFIVTSICLGVYYAVLTACGIKGVWSIMKSSGSVIKRTSLYTYISTLIFGIVVPPCLALSLGFDNHLHGHGIDYLNSIIVKDNETRCVYAEIIASDMLDGNIPAETIEKHYERAISIPMNDMTQYAVRKYAEFLIGIQDYSHAYALLKRANEVCSQPRVIQEMFNKLDKRDDIDKKVIILPYSIGGK